MIKKDALSQDYVDKLYSIFERNEWIKNKDEESDVFDRFCKRLCQLETDEQRDLVIELTKNFLWVKSEMYEQYLYKAFEKLFSDKSWSLGDNEIIFICPLMGEDDLGKNKSSTYLAYLCQSFNFRRFDCFQEKQVRILHSPNLLKDERCKDICKLILIDDFIGSGETAINALTYIESLNLNKKIETYILALVAQSEGINVIENKGVKVFANEVRNKGISDNFPKSEVKTKIEEMKKISSSLGVKRQFKLGFMDSESLVAMIKTPNNTFPVYWYKDYAPFPRCGNVKMLYKKEK